MGTTADKLNKLLETKTAIKNAIIAKGVEIADSDTFASYADKIENISGGGSQSKYGLTIDNFLGDVDETGVLQYPSAFSWNANGIKDIKDDALQYKFYASSISSVSFPNLVTISGKNALRNAFYGCTQLTTVDLSNLTTVSGDGCCYNAFYGCAQLTSLDLSNLTAVTGTESCRSMFQNCSNLTSADLRNLTTISGATCCRAMFYDCSKLASVNLNNLATITGATACQYMFYGCQQLTRVDFPSLTTVTDTKALTAMFSACSKLKEIHFRSDAQSVIEAQANYGSNLGATGATIYFDL